MQSVETIEAVRIFDAPVIPGLVFRHFRGEPDYPNIVAVRRGSKLWDKVEPLAAQEEVPTLERVRHTYADFTDEDCKDMLFVEVNGQVIGYNRIKAWTEENGDNVYLHLGYLLPQWRGKGIGTAMLHWSEQRIREMIAADPPTEGCLLYGANAANTEREATTLLLDEGYRPVWSFVDMKFTAFDQLPPAPILPAGFALWPVTPEHYREIYVVSRAAFSGAWGSSQPTEEGYEEFLDEYVDTSAYDPALWQVLWHGNTIVGVCLTEISDGRGIIDVLAVRDGWRRRGIARFLVLHALQTLKKRGIDTVRLDTDGSDASGAKTLYESLGFEVVKEHIRYRKPILLV